MARTLLSSDGCKEAEMDHPKTLIEFMELYRTEEQCRQAIFEHRWPGGFVVSPLRARSRLVSARARPL